MARGVFLHREDSVYDDLPAEKYQFPSQYLSRATKFVGDWIIYYEPRRGPTGRGYFGLARVGQIVPDPTAAGMYLAMIVPNSYLPFEKPVPFSGPEGVIERGLLNDAGRISGRAQAAVRPISLDDFNRILDRGMPDEAPMLPRLANSEMSEGALVREIQEPFGPDPARDRVAYYNNRLVRDRLFRRIVLDAYDCRCAITGLKLINGGGRAEVEAAHIKPVERNGPDDVRNGIALSGTAHWMFDRGLIGLSDDLEIMVSRQVNDVDSIWALVNRSKRATGPANPAYRPHPAYLDWHRINCFKH